MSDFRFLFAVHNHQPVGNFESVVDAAFEDCYRPFLECLERHPSFRFALHFSGPLWERMERKQKSCWDLVRTMSRRGQVELLGGGFYEPILSIIPEEDRIGQVRMMSDFLRENFGRAPRGLWLTERVWEPHLPKSLAAAGVEYTLLDEEHFHSAGIRDIHATYVTEEEGHGVRLFPISKKLRYQIPFRPLDDVRSAFEEIRAASGVAILGDDGEKFGVWPGTKKWVYEDGWLERFLRFIEDEGIPTEVFSDHLDREPPAGRVYLPPASYEEMMSWVLEPDDLARFEAVKNGFPAEARRFLRGGTFREFFLKYPEANHLHKRMVLVSREVRSAKAPGKALRDLYRGQCNDAYWHGVFGGLYLPHLREAVYHHLLLAENAVPPCEVWQHLDFDLDGRDELFLRGPRFSLLVKPSHGGALAEMDYRPWARNLSDVLSRRPESYHRVREGPVAEGEGKSIHEMAKRLPAGSEDLLRYDWYRRFSLVDHFFHPESTVEDFRKISYGEQGDFVDQPYVSALDGKTLRLERRGSVWVGQARIPMVVRKTIRPLEDGLRCDYEIENLSDEDIRLVFGSEWNILAFPEEIRFLGPRGISLYGGRLKFEFSGAADTWAFALRTLSQSEEGFDIIHQGYCLCPVWNLEIPGKGRTEGVEILLKEHHGR